MQHGDNAIAHWHLKFKISGVSDGEAAVCAAQNWLTFGMILDSEPLMDACVRAAGGECVRDSLGPNPSFDNADYLFRADNVLAELKSLRGDFLLDDGLQQKLHHLYNKWADQGKVVPLGYGEMTLCTDDLPPDCAYELGGLFKDKLESTHLLKKANNQIHESRQHLQCPDALGLLLLSNDGNHALDPAMAVYTLRRILASKYSKIEHVILFSPNLLISHPPGGGPSAFLFASICFPGRRQPSDEFLTRLGTQWCKVLGAATGRTFPPFGAFSDAGPNDIEATRFQSP